MFSSISAYPTEAEAVAAAKQQAIDESNYREDGVGWAVALTDDGDTITIHAKDGQITRENRTSGWRMAGLVNVSKAKESAVY